MRIKALILTFVTSLLWLALAAGLGLSAYYAAKYSAITFYYYYGQHELLESLTKQDPEVFDPALEGRLVQVSGTVSSDHMQYDPLYGVQAKGVRLERQVVGLPRETEGKPILLAPPDPPEPYLSAWSSTTPARMGFYTLESSGIKLVKLSMAARPVLSLMSLPPELQDQAVIDEGSIILPSVNGFSYRVRFVLGKEKYITYLGRQRGDTLFTDKETEWRSHFLESHAQLPLPKAMMNACFFALLAWAALIATLYALSKAINSGIRQREQVWYALLLAVVMVLNFYELLVNEGVLWSDPTGDHAWARVTRVFVPGHFPPDKVAAAHLWLKTGMTLCVVLALLPSVRRWLMLLKKRTKKA